MSNVLTFPLGGLEAVLTAIGEEINELAGVRLTRTVGAHSEGDTTLYVESVFGWETAGTIYVDGVRYTYSGTATSPERFTGLDSPDTIFTGLASDLRELTVVADGTEVYSGIENAKRMLFISTAEGEFLDIIGRNFGLSRPPGATDASYRLIIQALAYMAKGTVYSIELLLDLLVGPANYTIFEDLANYPNEVFIQLDAAITADGNPQGKGYLNAKDELTSTSTTAATLTYTPVTTGPNGVSEVLLAPELHTANFDVLPSAETPAWTYGGAATEGTAVTDNGDGTFNFADASGVNDGPYYTRALHAEEETAVVASFLMKRNSQSGADDSLFFRVRDGARIFGVGWDNTQCFLYDGTSRVGSNITVNTTAFHTYRLVKEGALDSTGRVKLYLDDVLVADQPYSSFGTTASRDVGFGCFSTTGQSDSDWSEVQVETLDVLHNYWNQRIAGDATTSSGDTDRISSTGTNFSSTLDAGRRITLSGSTVSHGRGNGTYEIQTVDAGGAWVDVLGVQHTQAAGSDGLDVVDTDRIRIDPTWDLFTAEDAGVQATLTTGTANSALDWTAVYGGADGNNITIQFLHATPVNVQVVVVDDGDGLEDIEITLANGTHTANDVIAAVAANPAAAALVTVALAAGSNGTSSPAIAAATNLAGGEDGKSLTISGSAGALNDGTYLIATLIDSRTVLLGSHDDGAAGLTVEADLNWRKVPNFPTDTGLDWETHASSSITGAAITTRRAMPFTNTNIVVRYQTVVSGQLLEGEFVTNNPVDTYFPLYLSDPGAQYRSLVDAITVAGVIPSFES
jgi:hypothetical protein